jgi:ketosteroid isomerase-like protein
VSQENVDVVRACFDVFDRGELRGAVDFLNPDIEWDVSGVLIDQEVIFGRDAVLKYLQQVFDTLPFTHEDRQFIDAGEQVCVLASLRGQGSGSGVELAHPVGYVMTVRDGAIIRSCFYGDHTNALKAVGLEE